MLTDLAQFGPVQLEPAQQRQQHIAVRAAHGAGSRHHVLHTLFLPFDEEALLAGVDRDVGIGRAQPIGQRRLLLFRAEQIALEFQGCILLQRAGLRPDPDRERKIEPGQVLGDSRSATDLPSG